MKFGIIGAGNGGHAFAAYLGLKGHEVYWYDIDSDVVHALNEQGGVYVSGKLNGFAPIKYATDHIQEVIEQADIIMVVAPANAHRVIAKNCSPHLKEKQMIVLNPGATGGALEFYQELKNNHCTADVTIAETQSLLFACRLESPGSVSIYGIKENLPMAAFPSERTESAYRILAPIFPEWVKGENVLEVSLGNLNAMLHPAPSLCSLTKIDQKQEFLHYLDGITGSVANFIEKMDEERINIGKAYGLDLPSSKQLLREFYGVEGETIDELTRNNQAYQTIAGAQTVSNRYFAEDIPMGLIPMSQLAKAAGVQTPTIDSIIHIVSSILDDDFSSSSRTLESMGLENKSVEHILKLIEQGESSQVMNG
ncbi:NAD/NADP-dependent octopine/nopaline dehydrogenase family protein [Halobacillus yeomjeoni]|uniref:NAD/NADP octopine/nopaline dehydrogenase family protein n=1 Tax=Halobacillus yeomjeoni TaxID=311194 RepID=A0A931HY50_9BACI|nr:NAD/NADP-dependent octopine/nopaline dehydrogenase family protein [Halobacillus yeomjeoni]MBH0231531.1 NAD/NADP octopine/nopaline dehydrogenase family protein [Halobacillus yeomjeoni]